MRFHDHCLAMALIGLMAVILLAGSPPVCRADFCYGWTEYSLEWVTDAANGIAVAEVTECDSRGQFQARIETVLKPSEDLALKHGQVVGGVCLGRSRLMEENQSLSTGPFVITRSRLGIPVYSEPDTYPGRNRALAPDELPRLRPEPGWGQGDQIVLFFGPSVDRVVQIVNLDRPLGENMSVDRPYLAADLHGKLVLDPDDLIRRVKQRVADGINASADGLPKVCHHGFYYWPQPCGLDGDDYHFVFVPPDPALKELCRENLTPELLDYATHGGELGVQPPRQLPTTNWRIDDSMAIWYWFYAGRTCRDFAGDRQRDFDRVLRHLRHQQSKYDRGASSARLHCRNYPGGWDCLISEDGRYLAYTDTSFVYVYDLATERPRAANPVFRTEDTDAFRRAMAFSPDSHYFAFSRRGGDVTVFDFDVHRVLWQGEFSLDEPDKLGCSQLAFSRDGKHLAHEIRKGSVRYDGKWRWADERRIRVWDAAKGECLLEPYDTWRRSESMGFDEEDSAMLLLVDRESPRRAATPRTALVWNVQTGEQVADPQQGPGSPP